VIIALGESASLTVIFYTKKAATINKVLLLTTSLVSSLLSFRLWRQRRVSSWKQAPGVRSQPPMEHFSRFKVAGSVSAFISSHLVRKHRLIDVAYLFSLVHAARNYLQQYLRYHNQGRNTLSDPNSLQQNPRLLLRRKKKKGDD
jgi:hypothetical protein